MLLIVNGTGPFSDAAYDRDFMKSFPCAYRDELGSRARYWRGPSGDGLAVSRIGDAAVAHAQSLSDSEPIHMCGRSRGGAAVVVAARRMARIFPNGPGPRRNPRITAMFLFDAVDREICIRADQVPQDVQRVYHARRDPRFALKYDDALLEAEKRLKASGYFQSSLHFERHMATRSPPNPRDPRTARMLDAEREYNSLLKRSSLQKSLARYTFPGLAGGFGNCATGADSGHYTEQFFMGTHGARGGVPWPADKWDKENADEDGAAATKVGAWMRGHLLSAGLGVLHGPGRSPRADA